MHINMDFNITNKSVNFSSESKLLFSCPQAPDFTWDTNNTILPWILVSLIAISSPLTIILNVLIIIAVKRRRQLQKLSNILLSSMAVTDLLVGAIPMPLSLTVDVLRIRQASLVYICILDSVNIHFMYCVPLSSLYHLTCIAWERYMAIRKSMEYMVTVTRGLLKKLAIIAWLSAISAMVPSLIMEAMGVDYEVVSKWTICVNLSAAGGLTVIAYFYIMVYIGVRKRKTDKISQITALVQAKLESKVAMTTGLLTGALIFSFVQMIVVFALGAVSPALRSSSAIRFSETLMQLNSLANPLLYCYRDRRFRNAVLELLRIQKSEAIQPAVGAARLARQTNNLFGFLEDAPELQTQTRSTSCDLAMALDCVHQTPHKTLLKRSMSTPWLPKCSSSLHNLQNHQLSFALKTSATIHAESVVRYKKNYRKLPKDARTEPQGTPHDIRNLPSSNSWADSASTMFTKRGQNLQERTVPRSKTTPPFSRNSNVPHEESNTSGFTTKL